jgi:hypothetical protein
MTAKRKTKQDKPKISKADHEWDIFEALTDDPLFQEIVEELLHPREVSRVEKLQSDICGFIDLLCDPDFCSEDNNEFEKGWKQFLSWNIELAKRQLIGAGIPNDKHKRLIVFGWACFDDKSCDIRFRFGPPLDGSKAALVILVFRDAVWHPPQYLEAAVWRHPVFRSAVGTNKHVGWRDRVMQRLSWAASLADEGPSSQRLRELSVAMTSMLSVSTHANPLEEGWIPAALENQRFWALLAHAVDFGSHQNARRLFMDGKLLRAAQQAALNEKIEKLPWFLMIEEVIREKFAETGEMLTPSALRKLFGVKDAPGSDQVVLEFPDPRFRQHGEITWGAFKKYAKCVGKIWSDHRTQ